MQTTRLNRFCFLGALWLAMPPRRDLPAQSPPIRTLLPTSVTSTQSFGGVLNIRVLSDGRVLVNDGVRRRVLLLDERLSNPRVVLDSIAGDGVGAYGPAAAPLIAFPGDSTLFVDGIAGALVVIGPDGRLSGAIAPPNRDALRFLAGSRALSDRRGNLYFRLAAPNRPTRSIDSASGDVILTSELPDSVAIVRADLASRSIDTIGRIRQESGTRSQLSRAPSGRTSLTVTIQPMSTRDEWTVLSGGSVALVRGHDYHIDWIRSGAQLQSTPRMPFEWKRMTDADKQQLVDSLRARFDSVRSAASARGGAAAGEIALLAVLRTLVSTVPGAPSATSGVAKEQPTSAPTDGELKITFVNAREIPDYIPPFRQGSVLADEENNLWILPTVTANRGSGELVYDVVNAEGVLFERVRVPSGRSIAGFGPRGAVYLMYRHTGGEWFIERTAVVGR